MKNFGFWTDCIAHFSFLFEKFRIYFEKTIMQENIWQVNNEDSSVGALVNRSAFAQLVPSVDL